MKLRILALPIFVAAHFAPAGAQMAPLDNRKVAETCGEMLRERVASMPRAEIDAHLACYAREFAEQLNLRVPVAVGRTTTLRRVTAEGTTLAYHYSVDVLRAELSPEMIEGAKAGTLAQACQSEEMRRIISIGGSYRYYWDDRNGERIGELLVDRC